MVLGKKDGKALVDSRLDVKTLLSGLWVVLMILYLYCDVLTFFRTGVLNSIMQGFMGPFKVNQAMLLSASLLMIIPACMVFLSLMVRANVNRWLNFTAGLLYTLVGIGNMIGEIWIYYIVFVILEMAVTLSIVVLSVKWPRRQAADN